MGTCPLDGRVRARRRAREGRTPMPTGVAIRDPRGQLFDAAERVLLRDGPGALTSRAVTAEAGVAKGVLHRHFADFDAFLVDLTLARIARISDQAAGLRAATGSRIPLLTESTAMIGGYLTAERELGRIASDADVGTLAATLMGAAHLLFSDVDGAEPDAAAVGRVVTTVVAPVSR